MSRAVSSLKSAVKSRSSLIESWTSFFFQQNWKRLGSCLRISVGGIDPTGTTLLVRKLYLGQFDGKSSLGNVLRKEETHPYFKKIYNLLGPGFGQSRSRRKSRTKPASTALGDILGLKSSDLTLRGRVFDRFCEVQRTPSLFWRSLIADDSPWAARASPDVVVGKAYVASQGVCADRQWQTVRWRFYTVFFYRLAYLYSNDASKISDKAKARLLDVIRRSNLVYEGSKVTKEHIEKMVSKGSRYTKFCQELWKKEYAEGDMLKGGYGPLFFLPSIADNM